MFNPYLAVVITTIIWGSSGVFIKYLNLPLTTIAFFRTFIPAIILYFYFKFKGINPFRKNLKLIFLVSSIAILELFLYFFAYKNASIANSVIILYTWPIFVVAISIIFLKEKIPKRNLFLVLMAFIGVIFVYFGNTISFSDKDFIGITAMLISAVLFAIMIIIFKKLSQNHTNLEIIFYHNFLSAIVFFPFLFVNKPFPTTEQSTIGVIYALLIGLLAYILYYFSLKSLKASTISLLSYLEVVSGILFGVFLLHETLTLNMIIGGILIVGSAILIRR